MPDLMQILINASKIAPVFIMLMQAICLSLGVIIVAAGLIDLYLLTNDNSSKMFSSSSRSSTTGATTKIVVGGFLLALGTLQLVGILSRTITGDYVNSRIMSYSPSGSSMADQAQLALLGLFSIMQAVGFTAILRGFMALIQRNNGNIQGNGYAIITAWFIGGILAWNFKWTSDVINNTLGFDIISKLTPFS